MESIANKKVFADVSFDNINIQEIINNFILLLTSNNENSIIVAASSIITAIPDTQDALHDIELISDLDFSEGSSIWLKYPIWHGASWLKAKEQLEDLLNTLRDVYLDFLADDFEKICFNIPIDFKKRKYDNFSAVISSNPNRLKMAVLGSMKTKNNNIVRLMLVGPGGAGKTSLASLLRGKEVQINNLATLGIETFDSYFIQFSKINHLNSDDFPQIHLWDFAGQTIFYGLHNVFLYENCVYILVVDSRHGHAPDEWLQQINEISKGKSVPVFIITNLYENCQFRQNETRLQREFPNLLKHRNHQNFFYFSCINDESIEFQGFMESLNKSCLSNQRSIFEYNLNIKNNLLQKRERSPFVTKKELFNVIGELTDGQDKHAIINELTSLGFILILRTGALIYCIDLDWIIKKSCQILYNVQQEESIGFLSKESLCDQLSSDIDDDELDKIIDFLEFHKICTRLNNDAGHYFFPDASVSNEPNSVSELINALGGNKSSILFDLPLFPFGLHAQLVSSFFSSSTHEKVKIKNHQDIWRNGFVLTYNEGKAIVQYLSGKTSIELILIGNSNDILHIIEYFYYKLKDLLGNLSREKMHVTLIFNENIISPQITEGFVFIRANLSS